MSSNQSNNTIIYLKDYQPANFLIDSVDLHVDLHEDHTRVVSSLSLRTNPTAESCSELFLNGEDLLLEAIECDGAPLPKDAYTVSEYGILLHDLPSQCQLTTTVVIHPETNTLLMGLYQSSGNFCTQCEAEGFRRITYFLDRPDVMSRYRVTIEADQARYPMLLSNGNCLAERQLPNGRHEVVWQDPSLKPCYLFALVAGDFDLIEDTFITCSGRSVELRFYLEKGFREQGYFALDALKRAMRWDEEVYRREYDLDIYMVVAVSDFTMGAMENKGLNVFNTSAVLAKPDTATDRDYAWIEAVVGHEYFHNWSGNRVTCRDWFQLTLKEGLTVFREHGFSMDMCSASMMRLQQVQSMRNAQFAEDAGPMAHPIRSASYIEINNFYTSTVYQKGAEVIRMVETFLGKTVFQQGMDLYFSRFDGQAVTTEDFIAVMEEVSGRDLTQFKRWYDQAGTPELTISQDYSVDDHTWTLHVKQQCPATPGQTDKKPFHLPLAIGAVDHTGQPIELSLDASNESSETLVLDVTQPEQSFTIEGVSSQPVPSLLREFSAPVKVHYDYTVNELSTLIQHDSDPVARWDAGQTLMTSALTVIAQQYESQQTLVMEPALTHALGQVIERADEDPMMAAQLLAFPSMTYLMQTDSTIDVLSWHEARQFAERVVADVYEDVLLQAYHQSQSTEPYQFNAQDYARRSWMNTCLAYLVKTKKVSHLKRAFDQYEQADNMTDTMAALQALNHQQTDLRDKALDTFYEQWQHEPLVINKWLGLHASTTLPHCLEQVRELMQHQAFHLSNPNNVYALIRGYAGNPVGFHSPVDGQGYAFIADQVLALDSINSLVAGRIVRGLMNWRQLTDARGQLMRSQLERVANTSGLSSDVYEVAHKSL